MWAQGPGSSVLKQQQQQQQQRTPANAPQAGAPPRPPDVTHSFVRRLKMEDWNPITRRTPSEGTGTPAAKCRISTFKHRQ
ncbi:hypothetical protein EYF80_065863 [Liparis tanakae]|uniref:Uncharacterized protein n=1 Tax=Liparis tanakae TaxID=230148 RepID=A0A4Z2E5Y0_9TELE|nr:hypothetical protein EYF80_065863 [Liparis tanakae]